MKYLLLTVQPDDGDSTDRTYLLEGDRRQTPRDMILRAFEQLLGEDVEAKDDPFRGETTDGRSLVVDEYQRVGEERVSSLKGQHLTLVVNENVTEQACRVGYSGPYSGS